MSTGFLQDLNLDIRTAEKEPELIKDKNVFLETNSWEVAKKPHTNLILGRKGSGKSAIRIALGHHLEYSNCSQFDISFDSFEPADIAMRVAEARNHYKYFRPEAFFRNLWKYIIVSAAVYAIKRSNLPSSTKDKVSWAYNQLMNPGKLPRCLNDKLGFDHRLAFNDSLEKIQNLDNSLNHDSLQDFPAINEYEQMAESLRSALSDKCKVLLTLDDFDRHYEEFANIVQPMLLSLTDAIHDLHNLLGEKMKYLMIKCFIPSDAIGPNDHRHYDKIQPHTINWSLLELCLFVAKRAYPTAKIHKKGIPSSPPNAKSYDTILKSLFTYQPGLPWDQYTDPISFLSHLTLGRPRDILEALYWTRETIMSRNPSATSISVVDIQNTEGKISEELYQKTLSEYSTKYPDLAAMVEQLRGSSPTISKERIANRLSIDTDDDEGKAQLESCVSSLYESGFICRYVSTKDRVGSISDKNLAVPAWRDDHPNNTKFAKDFIIHRAFWDALDIPSTYRGKTFKYIS